MEYTCGSVGYGFGVVTAGALVTAVVWIQSLTWELPLDVGVVNNK